jgi:HSP20 family protein
VYVARRRDIDRLRGEIDELLTDLWQIPRFAGLRHGFRPQIDCFRTSAPEGVTVIVDLAGVDPADVHVVLAGRRLVISGERPRPREEGRRYEQVEIDYGPFQRELTLSEDVDPEGAKASYERGLLVIELPIAQRPRGQTKVPIAVRGSR